MTRKALVMVALAIVVSACGKRGDPHPPIPVIPKETSDLVVAQRGAKIMLSWSYPSLTTAGKNLPAVRRVVLYRYTEELPVTQPPRDAATLLPGDVDPTAPQGVAAFSKVPPLGPAQFIKLRTRLDSIEGANLPAATAGARLIYDDSPPFHASDGRPVRLFYGVVTESSTGSSALSNLASIVPVDVPVPPLSLTAIAKPEGVVLTWTAPDAVVTGKGKPHITGYNIYRAAGAEKEIDLTTPINAAPVSQTTFTDVPGYGAYQYRITAVAVPGTTRIESDPSPLAAATFKDLMPPPVPTGVAALVETRAIRLLWEAVDAPDLAGYKIYRSEGSGAPLHASAPHLPLTPKPYTTTNFRDISVDPGISYFYEITAVDKNGNESAPAKSDWVLVPKTP